MLEGVCIKGFNFLIFIFFDWCGDNDEVRDSDDCEFDFEDKFEWFFLLFIVVENVFGIVVGLWYFFVDLGEMLIGWVVLGCVWRYGVVWGDDGGLE